MRACSFLATTEMWIYLGQLLNGLNQGETFFPEIGLSDWADVCAIQQYIVLR
jgi:hypothetical protein